jgi:hypothetical protein
MRRAEIDFAPSHADGEGFAVPKGTWMHQVSTRNTDIIIITII